MAPLTAKQVIGFVRETQERFQHIDHADWDAKRGVYRSSNTAKWYEAANQAVPPELAEWREIVRVLAQGESYYGGRY